MRCGWLLAFAIASAACGTTADDGPKTPADLAIEEGARKTSSDPTVNPDAAAMAEFKANVDAYADLHQRLARGDAELKQTSDPARIDTAMATLASRIQAARKDAKHGDIFTPTVRPAFRRLLAPHLKGEEGRDAKAILKDDAPEPGTVPFKVNAPYPDDQPRPTVPASLLLTLPTLPEPLEYRIVGQHLLLLDTEADLIVDYVLNAITT